MPGPISPTAVKTAALPPCSPAPDGIKVTLTGDKTINSWQVCTGNEIGEKARQAGVAVEPMTAYADAFRTGKDLVVLEPGDDYTTVVTFHAEQI